ncbi:YciI family protein [Spongiibacter taiwanensis]|uniref:YciI family protein n=1 Tax=Spongiibacter taiwanensis TaxID=1748242 RepID=UPI0020352CAC|nr:YciI family protein [Spongiibacter taiwanensis]USA41708.1 YciI family protein [Spongiibacter taiwanensis]
MKYLCLVYGEESLMATMDDRECMACVSGLMDSGHFVAGQALQPVATATSLRVRNGKVSVTDGPFAETKEQLAGFYLLEARDLNEALDKAAKIPPARIGTIEVRPIRELQG